MQRKTQETKGPVVWMAGNSVAANLLMLILVIGGLLVGSRIKQEVFPEYELNTVSVSVSYSGASPAEVDKGIVLPVEEAVQGLDGINSVTSTANEGGAKIVIEALDDADVAKLWQEVQSAVARISTFPAEADEPEIVIDSRKKKVMTLALHGKSTPLELRAAAELVRDALLQQSDITQVDMLGVQDFEVTVEVPQATLRRYGLTLQNIADTIRQASVEVGGGSLKTAGGEILIRMNDRREYARDYARIPILSGQNGSRVLLGDIATVRDGFEETQGWAEFDGERAVLFDVYRVGDQKPVDVANAVNKVVQEQNRSLHGFSLSIKEDKAKIFTQRADLLLRNSYMGLALVFLCLALFLEIRLAFWVSLGIPISFLGSFLLLPMTDFSINMITMFAFIVTLGIVVDDAIVVGENVYHKRQQGMPPMRAAIEGARDIAMPVTFSVLTNIVAFMPMYFVPGRMGQIFGSLPVVVICVFTISLIESVFILPAHLAHSMEQSGKGRLWGPLRWLEAKQRGFSEAFERFVRVRYGAMLKGILAQRYTVLAVSLALLLATGGYVASGRMGMVLFPKIESDYSFVEATLPYGVSLAMVQAVQKQLVDAADELVAEHGGDALAQGIFSRTFENTVEVRVYLTDPEVRPLSTSAFTELWRKRAGTIIGLETIDYASDRGGPGSGKPLSVELLHRDTDVLHRAAADLAAGLETYASVTDVDDGSARGKQQYEFTLLPAAERMGLTSRAVATQVRNAFQGADALSQLRGRNEVTVKVRLPRRERELQSSIENFVLRAPDGQEIMLRDAATMLTGRAYTSITRQDGRRAVTVLAEVNPRPQMTVINSELKRALLPQLQKKYPGLGYRFSGKQADLQDSTQSLYSGLLMALLCIYALLAIPFRSYSQPLIIMVCIPFGLVGAVWGLILLGYSMSLMSLFGMVALSGVVVNDSLVLIDFANRKRTEEGASAVEAVQLAGVSRFRPILLTTLTTFGGLAPMIFETSRQAKFLIPMAVSLGFGILFATLITLVLVPALYLILEDIHEVWRDTPVTKSTDGVGVLVEKTSH